ncbi:MAG: anthranilate synthase component I family protein [Nitrospiraceae bacterium]|nr:MAG: anthranilate synthase component I family protein [Nitrospiraceae bacterium]
MPTITPSKSTFVKNARAGKPFPVYTELPYIAPQAIYATIHKPFSFLLESIKGPEHISRYSFIGSDPFLTFEVKDGNIKIHKNHNEPVPTHSPLRALKNILRRYKTCTDKNLPPFSGGAVGLISYDFVHYFERLPSTATDDLKVPDAHFLMVDTVIAVDHTLKKTVIMSCPGAAEIIAGDNDAWEHYYENAAGKIRKIYSLISSLSSDYDKGDGEEASPLASVKIHHEMDKADYMHMVTKAKDYIHAGDIFQANLSQRVSAYINDISAWKIYRMLSRINPSPFAAYLDMEDYQIVSSSPERLVRVNGDIVETRPIAGTRPRGTDADSDNRMRSELLLNEKERAEHLMLIDLERNDLGKISDYSTVEVDEFMITEDYSHVIHIVSNIRGSIAKGRDCFDAIRATFPGGTITGVPKVRCMEIIDELEPVTRGPYTGSVGYIGFDGSMDLNIIIRTFLIKNKTAYVQAGAGIVADSDPEKEYYETLKKAEALIKTLEEL